MPRLSPARAAAKRQQIIDAAFACFAERGFHKATMQDVVRASGLSPGSIYCHFTSKEEIVNAAVAARHAGDVRSLELALAATSLEDALTLLARAFFPARARRADRSWRRLAVQLWAESLQDPTLLKAVRAGVERPRQLLVTLLRRSQQRGEIAVGVDPEAMARILIAVFQGLTLQQAWNESVDAAICVRALCRLLLAGELKADPEPPL